MKIVNILGGLGNQMFQYALYLALREKFKNEVVKVDRSCLKVIHYIMALNWIKFFR